MHNFDYHRPRSLDDAAQMIAADEDGKIVAGGMTLIPTLKQRLAMPSQLIDLSAIADIKGIQDAGSSLVIGAMTTHAAVAGSETVKARIPALGALAKGIGDPQVRNRGTIGGSLANADPAADYPAAVLALGATIETNKRQIPGDEFFLDLFETALEESEIIKAVHFSVPEKAAYMKFANPASRYAIVGVFVSQGPDGVRVGVTGAGPKAFRHSEAEAALTSNFSPEALANLRTPPDGLNSDIHASADYRAHLVDVMAKRAVAAALA